MLGTERPNPPAVHVHRSDRLGPLSHPTQSFHVRPGDVPRPDDGSADRTHAAPTTVESPTLSHRAPEISCPLDSLLQGII